jgi:hypothetical protein
MQGLEFVILEVQRFRVQRFRVQKTGSRLTAHGSWLTAHGLKDRHQAYCVRNGYRVKGKRYKV